MNDLNDEPQDTGMDDPGEGAKNADNPEPEEAAGELGGGSQTGALGGGQPTEPTEPTEAPRE